MCISQQFDAKRLEDKYPVQKQILEIVTRPPFHADRISATDVHKLFSKLSSGYLPPYHFGIYKNKNPYKKGFKSSWTRGTLTFSNSQPGVSDGYPVVMQLIYSNSAMSSSNTHLVFLVLGTCEVSTCRGCDPTILIQTDRTIKLVTLNGDPSMSPSATASEPSRACTRGFLDIDALTITFRSTSRSLWNYKPDPMLPGITSPCASN